MIDPFAWPYRAIYWAVIAAFSAGASWLFGLSFWLLFGGIAVGLLVNGWIIDWEDDQPGGWTSPY